MSKTTSIPWWSSLGLGKPERAPDTDYADMGTAFGLDASFDTLPMPEGGSAAEVPPDRAPPDGARRDTKR